MRVDNHKSGEKYKSSQKKDMQYQGMAEELGGHALPSSSDNSMVRGSLNQEVVA